MITVASLGSSADQVGWSALSRELGELLMDPEYLGIVSEVCGGRGGCAPRGEVRVIEARRDGELVGVLPLAVGTGLAELFALRLDPVPAVLATDPASAAALARAALAEAGHRPLRLWVGDSSAPNSRAIVDAWRQAGRRVLTRHAGPRLQVRLDGEVDDYLAGLPSRFTRDLRRRERRLRERGRLEASVKTDTAGLDAWLAEAWTVEASGWKGRAGSAIAAQPRLERFYRRLAHWAAARGQLWLVELRLDGAIVAFYFGLRVDGFVWLLKTGYSEPLSTLSLGHLVLREVITLGAEQGIRVLDLMGAAESHKRRWATHEVHGAAHVAFPAGPLGDLELAAARGGAAAIRGLRRAQTRLARDRARAERLAGAARSRIAGLRPAPARSGPPPSDSSPP